MELTRASHEPSFSRRMPPVGFPRFLLRRIGRGSFRPANSRQPLAWLQLLSLAVGFAAGGHVATAQADPAGTIPPVWIGRRLAEQADLAPGDTVSLARKSITDTLERFLVAGVFPDPAEPAEIAERNAYLRLRLNDLDRIAGANGTVDRIAIRLRDPARAPEVAGEMNAMAFGFRAHTAKELANETSESFVVIRRFHVAISLITVFGGGVFVMAIMLLKVEELRRELGVLRLIGISRRTIVKSLLLEAALLTLAGSAVSVGIGAILSVLVNAYYRAYYETTLVFSRITPGILLASIAISIGLGLLAGGLAAWRLSRRSPLELVGR